MTLMVGSLTAAKIRVVTPWNGPWYADCEVVLGDSDIVPTGSTTVQAGGATLVGTVDPRSSGRMGATAYVRVVAGAGGWDKPVPAVELHNDAGVLSSVVLQTVAAVVGETVVDGSPTTLGVDWVRFAGVASKVFGARPWYVDVNGITQVAAPRAPQVAPADLLVSGWDPAGEIAELVTDTLLQPGISLTDARWDGAIVARDLEQVFEGEDSKVTAVCSSAAISRMQTAFKSAVVEASGVVYARRYRFRVVSQGGDGRLTLQAVSKAPGAPDAQLITAWYGVPGLSAKVTPGTIVHGVLVEGDPTLLVVVGFDATAPIELDAVATAKATITAPEIDLAASALVKISAPVTQANGSTPVALAPGVTSALSAISTVLTAIGGALAAIDTALAAPATTGSGATANTAVGTATASIATALQALASHTLQAG